MTGKGGKLMNPATSSKVACIIFCKREQYGEIRLRRSFVKIRFGEVVRSHVHTEASKHARKLVHRRVPTHREDRPWLLRLAKYLGASPGGQRGRGRWRVG